MIKSIKGIKLSLIVLVGTIILIGVNFQNCSNMSSSDYGGKEADSQGEGGALDDIPVVNPNPNPNPGGDVVGGLTATFSQGDRYGGEVLVSGNSFLDSLITKYDYPSYSFSKAIAVSETGLGYMSMTDINDTAEAERMAMESCNLLTGLPCALIVSENTFVINSSDLNTHLDYLLDGYKGQSFNRSRIPMASSKIRGSALISNYIGAAVQKALAVSITGGVYATYTYSYQLSEEEVKRMAVQQCELEAALVPCVLYAVNDEVVFDPGDWVKISSLTFNTNNVMAIPPPASRDLARQAIQDLLDATGRDQKYAIVITPNGYGFFGIADTKDAAVSEAMANCNSGAHGSRCIEYASSAGITFSTDDLKAKEDHGDMFCKTVRYSCADHFNVGCSGGSRWVQNSRSLAAERVTCGN